MGEEAIVVTSVAQEVSAWTAMQLGPGPQDHETRKCGWDGGLVDDPADRNLAMWTLSSLIPRLWADEHDPDRDDHEDESEVIRAEQAGHSPHVECMIYGRALMERSEELASKREHFRHTSIEWHRFLGFPMSDAQPNQ